MLNHHVRFSHYFPFLKKEINEIFLVHSIDGFVNSLFGIFVPIYLLTLGFSVSQVLIYYILKYLAVSAFFFLVGYISNRLGLKHTMLARLPFFLLFLILLYFLSSIYIPLIMIILLHAFYEAMYWMPLHSLFARSAKHYEMGSQVGKLSSLPKIAHIIAPLIGGSITVFFGFGTLFLVSMVLLATSIVPLFYTPEIKPHVKFSMREVKDIVKKHIKYFLGLGFQYISDSAEIVIWPIFVFLTLRSLLSIGMIGSLLAAGGILFTLLVGKLSDKVNKKFLIRMGAGLMALIYFFRFFVSTEASIYLLTILAGFFIVLLFVPFDSIIYNIAKKSNIDEFIIIREIFVTIGRISLLIIALAFVDRLGVTFIVTSVSQLFFLFF